MTSCRHLPPDDANAIDDPTSWLCDSVVEWYGGRSRGGDGGPAVVVVSGLGHASALDAAARIRRRRGRPEHLRPQPLAVASADVSPGDLIAWVHFDTSPTGIALLLIERANTIGVDLLVDAFESAALTLGEDTW